MQVIRESGHPRKQRHLERGAKPGDAEGVSVLVTGWPGLRRDPHPSLRKLNPRELPAKGSGKLLFVPKQSLGLDLQPRGDPPDIVDRDVALCPLDGAEIWAADECGGR